MTPEGVATNIHLVGQSEQWHNKLQAGLLNWDHDKNIVDNIMTVFGNWVNLILSNHINLLNSIMMIINHFQI